MLRQWEFLRERGVPVALIFEGAYSLDDPLEKFGLECLQRDSRENEDHRRYASVSLQADAREASGA